MKRTIATCLILGLVLFTSLPAFAGQPATVSSKQAAPVEDRTLNQIIDEALKVQKTGMNNVPPDLLLFQHLMPCLEKCQTQFESCMQSAGDDPTKQFRCGEQRTACTLACDNQYYNWMPRTGL